MAKDDHFYGLGRRKAATATARLKSGKGVITINDQTAESFLSDDKRLLWKVVQPLAVVELEGKYDLSLKVQGGGLNGQIDACTLAIAKALADMNDDLRSTLKRAGFMKRDPREKERKKPGLKRARKREQFSKR